MEWIIKKKLSFTEIQLCIMRVGEDYCIIVQGGTKSHIGCTVLAVPRPSLENPNRRSATSSVINVTGHKDDNICRILAERVAAESGRVIVCSGGIHIDHIDKKQLQDIIIAIEKSVEEIVELISYAEGSFIIF